MEVLSWIEEHRGLYGTIKMDAAGWRNPYKTTRNNKTVEMENQNQSSLGKTTRSTLDKPHIDHINT